MLKLVIPALSCRFIWGNMLLCHAWQICVILTPSQHRSLWLLWHHSVYMFPVGALPNHPSCQPSFLAQSLHTTYTLSDRMCPSLLTLFWDNHPLRSMDMLSSLELCFFSVHLPMEYSVFQDWYNPNITGFIISLTVLVNRPCQLWISGFVNWFLPCALCKQLPIFTASSTIVRWPFTTPLFYPGI